MEWLKPTRRKVLFTVILVVLFIAVLYLFSLGLVCKMCPSITSNPWPDLTRGCDCKNGGTFSEFIFQLLVLGIIPLIVVYFIYSLISLVFNKLRNQ